MRFFGDAISCAALLALVFGPIPFLRWRDCRDARKTGLSACAKHIHMGGNKW